MKMDDKLSFIPEYENISSAVLAQAAEFYIYLVTKQDDYWLDWYDKIDKIFESKSFARNIGKSIM